MNAEEILALLKINELSGRMPGYAHFASAADHCIRCQGNCLAQPKAPRHRQLWQQVRNPLLGAMGNQPQRDNPHLPTFRGLQTSLHEPLRLEADRQWNEENGGWRVLAERS